MQLEYAPIADDIMVQHPLDLPNLALRPDAATLLRILKSLQRSSLYTPFKSSAETVSSDSSTPPSSLIQATETNPALAKTLFTWLTNLVANPLAWIPEDSEKEQIWDLASMRMAERCGRTASPKQIREINFPEFRISLVEPSLTSDSLGLTTWGSSMVLAERLIRDHNDCLVDPVLELGAGTGLCGIVMGKLGYKVCVTDLPEIVDNLKVNVANNNSGQAVDVQTLDWTKPDDFDYKTQTFNSIVVSDPIYSEDHPAMVCNMVSRFLAKTPSARLCVQLPLRQKFDKEREDFYTRLSKLGLTRLLYEEQSGYDDFGSQEYAWSLWAYDL